MTDEIDDEYQQDNAHDNHNSSSHSSNDQTTVAVIPGQNNRGKKVVAARFRPKQRVTKSVAVNDANTGEARSVVSAKKSNTAFASNENTSTSVRNGATVKGRDDSICQKPGPGNDSKRASAMMDGVDETVTDKNDIIEDKESNKSDTDSKVVKASTLSSSARTSSTRSVVQAGSSFGKRRSTGSAVVVGESSFSTSSPSKVVASTLPQSPKVAASVQVASIADGSASHSIKANSSSNGAVIIPRPLAGELSLKDFCSKYRDPSAPKKKRGRKRKGEADDENNEKETTKESEFDDVEENKNKPRKQKAKMTKIVSNKSSVRNMDSSEPVVDSSGPVVELVDGEIVIRESSLVVGGGDTNVDEEYEEVHEGAGEMTATYTSFTNRTKRKTWSAEETKLFYEALRQVGPDFSMMNAFFVDRDRKQLKNKYKVETRKNPQLIQMALERERQKPIDLDVFEVTQEDIEAVTVVTNDNDDNKESSDAVVEDGTEILSPSSDTPIANKIDASIPALIGTINETGPDKSEEVPADYDDAFAELNDNVAESIPLPGVKRKKAKSVRPKARPRQKKSKVNDSALTPLESVDV